jgi:ferredoxin
VLSEGLRHTVRLLLPDDREVELEVAPDEAIWDAAQKAGHLLPYGCLQGWCLSCAGRVLEGDFDPWDALRYYEIDKQERFILLCTAKPRSDMTIQTHQKIAMQQHRIHHKLPTPRG